MAELCSACGAEFREGDAFCAKCGTSRTTNSAAPTGAPPPDGAQDEAKAEAATKRRMAVAVGALFAGFPLVLMLAFGLVDCDGDVEGGVQVRGGPHGDFDFVPTGCASMQPYGRMGANVHGVGHNDGAVYVSGDPVQGPSVDIEVPGSCRNTDGTDCTVFHVPRERCEVWEARVVPTGTIVNEVRLVEGHVRLRCALEDGTSVEGSVRFGGC